MLTSPSAKPCIHCGKDFTPKYSAMQVACSLRCAVSYAKKQREDKAKVERATDRQRKRDLMRLAEFRAEAQEAFNKFIRARDADKPCVSCNETNPPITPGGQWDAGHFLGRGAYPELALNEDNCHKQCKVCNGGSGKFAHKERTVTQKYEVELLNRIGPERLAALRAPHPPALLRRADYEALTATYRQKLKELQRSKSPMETT